MQEEGLDQRVIEKLGLEANEADLDRWKQFVERIIRPSQYVKVALVGKYVEHHDAYTSIVEALIHGGGVNDTGVEIPWVQSDDITDDNVAEAMEGVDGILVAPGFGDRGVDGKLSAVTYARENRIPFFGICRGTQCAGIQVAGNAWRCGGGHS